MIDINSRGAIVSEVSASVVRDSEGKPRLQPTPGTSGHWNAVLERHAGKGQLRVTLERVHERRSSAQNRLLWAVYRDILAGLRELAAGAGELCPFKTDDDLHEALKYILLGTSIVKLGGKEIEVPATTTRLTVEQFSAYLDGVLKWAAERRIFIELQQESA